MTTVAAPTAEQAVRTAYARIAKPGQPANLSTVYQIAQDRTGLDILDLMDAVDAMRVAGQARIRLLEWTIAIPATPAVETPAEPKAAVTAADILRRVRLAAFEDAEARADRDYDPRDDEPTDYDR